MIRRLLVGVLVLVGTGCDGAVWRGDTMPREDSDLVLDARVPATRAFCIEELGSVMRCVPVGTLRELVFEKVPVNKPPKEGQ